MDLVSKIDPKYIKIIFYSNLIAVLFIILLGGKHESAIEELMINTMCYICTIEYFLFL